MGQRRVHGETEKSVIMKFLLALTLIAVASAAKINYHMEPYSTKFTLLEERSANGAPTVTITFPDGYTDTLVLSKYYSSEEDRMAGAEACHYVGHLANERDACAAMTGCIGSEDIDLTIMSRHAESTMFRWTKDGKVEVIESPFKNGNSRSDMLLRGDDGWDQDFDEMVNEEVEAAEKEIEELCTGTACTSVPATNLLQIKAGYDDGFLAKVGGTTAAAEAYIKSTMPHVQVSYCHSSLGTKISIQRIGDIKHYSGRNLQATGAKLQEMGETTRSDLGTADLMMYMGYESDYYGTVGIAWGKVVCNSAAYNHYKESINEWRNTHAEAGHVIAHEIGHNLGMDHDFSTAHAAAGCNGKGIMSYGDPPNQWSECSVKDLQAHYLANKNNWCMDSAPTACDGSGTTPTTAAPAPATTTVAPALATCDLSDMFGGNKEVNGNFNFGFTAWTFTAATGWTSKTYNSDINCTNSVCKPNVAGISNACEYICGSKGPSCPGS